MKKTLLGTVSAFMLAGAIVPSLIVPASAQMTMHFSAPFISNSGLVGAAKDRHFFTVAVTGFPLESLRVTLPNEMRPLDGAMVLDQKGKEVAAKVTPDRDGLTINFLEPVQPNDYLTVRLLGVKMFREGGTALYRITAVNKGFPGTFPIGTAMINLSADN
jgi:hypothetical protein